MGLATDLIRFFHLSNAPLRDNIARPWAISDFLGEHPQYNGYVFELNIACNRLSAEGLLNHAGNTGTAAFYGDCYYSMITAKFTEEIAAYGRVHLTFADTSSRKLTIEISTAKRKDRGNTLDIPLRSR